MHEPCRDPGGRSPARADPRTRCLVPVADEERDAELWWQRVGGLAYGPDELGDCDDDGAHDARVVAWLTSGPCWRPDFTDCDPC